MPTVSASEWYIPGQTLWQPTPVCSKDRHLLAAVADKAFLAERSVLAGWCLRWLCFRHGRTAANTALCLEYLRSSGSTKGGMRRRWKATSGGSVWGWTADGDGASANGANAAAAIEE